MGTVASSIPTVGNWLKHVYDNASGYCFETIAKSSLPALAKSGSVIDATGALVTVANTANAWGILVDDLNDTATQEKTQCLVLVRGPAIVATAGLTFGADVDTDTEKDAVMAVLATKGIVAEKQF